MDIGGGGSIVTGSGTLFSVAWVRGVLAGDQSTYERALGYTRPPMDDVIFTLRERLLAQR